MKTKFLHLMLLFGVFTFGQVGINTTTPNPSSMLEVNSDNSGVLISQVALTSTTDTTTITNGNVNSLLVFNTATVSDVTPGYYYWHTDRWHRFLSGGSFTGTWFNQDTNLPAELIDEDIYQSGKVATGGVQDPTFRKKSQFYVNSNETINLEDYNFENDAIYNKSTVQNESDLVKISIVKNDLNVTNSGEESTIFNNYNKSNIINNGHLFEYGSINNLTDFFGGGIVESVFGVNNFFTFQNGTDFSTSHITGFQNIFSSRNNINFNRLTSYTSQSEISGISNINTFTSYDSSLYFPKSNISTLYGVYISHNKGITSTITNSYGIYINSISGTNKWGIYQNQSNVNNYFNGNVGIGIDVPAIGSKLHVNSTDSIIIPVGTSTERPTTPLFGMLRYNTSTGRGEMYVNDLNGDGTQGDAGWRAF